MYKSDMVATQNVVMGEIKRKEAKKRKAEKSNSKHLEQRTGG